MRLIGLHAKARSGKDETATILCKMYGFKQVAFADLVKELAIKYFEQEPEKVYEKKNKESRLILQGIGQAVRENLTSLYEMYELEESPDVLQVDPLSNLPKWVGEIAMEDFELPPAFLNMRRKQPKKIMNGIYKMFTENLENFHEIAGGKGEDFWINYLMSQCTEDIVYVVSDVRYLNEKKVIEDNGGYVAKIIRLDKSFVEHGEQHPSEIELDEEHDWLYHISNEHKTDWREHLIRQSANMIRKIDSLDFFSDSDKEKFKINIYEHE